MTDTSDFLKKESELTNKYIQSFLTENGILELDRERQMVETAKLIAKFPWGESRTIEELLVTKKFGTCTAKHLALQKCYEFLNIPCYQVMSTFKWSEQGVKYPEELQAILDKGEWDHGHNFLRVQKDDGVEIDIDVTWNSKLKDFGFKVLPEDWDGKTSFIGLNINQRWNNVNMKAKKIELIESLTPELRERREQFLKLFIGWIQDINGI